MSDKNGSESKFGSLGGLLRGWQIPTIRKTGSYTAPVQAMDPEKLKLAEPPTTLPAPTTPTSPLDLKPTEDGLLSLTALHKLAVERGLAGGKLDPGQWKRLDETQSFVKHCTATSNMCPAHIWKSKRGNGGGTYAHPLIALEYAGYLSHDLRIEVNNTYLRAQAGDVNPPRTADSQKPVSTMDSRKTGMYD